VAGEGEAARLVSYIRSDEAPHVAWLRTALSEMRDRTWVGTGGRGHAGSEMIETLWDRALHDSVLLRRQENLAFTMREVEHALAVRPNAGDIIEEMLSMGSVVRLEDGTLTDPPGTSRVG
jgi:hypothetical protein